MIDEAFLSSLPGAGANAVKQLQPMIDQGYITRSNGAMRTQILFREGQVTFNGKPFNPAAKQPARRHRPQSRHPKGVGARAASSGGAPFFRLVGPFGRTRNA